MDQSWLKRANNRYEECNRLTLQWILSREPLRGHFLDTKVNSITGVPFGDASGLKGPSFTYGWIQGRGLEALVTFSDHYKTLDKDFSNKLLNRAKLVFDGLSNLHKKDELDSIMKETEKEENGLIKKSNEFESKIDESLLNSYKKIRSSVKNGLAVVPVERGASAGSFFVIPPQIQLDIASRKKLITDEHSGRILVDKDLAEEEENKMEGIFSSI